ncbi:hypothetical protein DEIPH_ctg045orf0001 [Deinococcus phoenicis]|uniref:Uncharacterized protein n=1 Tax=Deinococcus phoenicis TaxID=1476583 RepID=A0A016QMH1_9DEIO|nr:hypothetical protein [Deinococcus phoenicis]EYB67273.1 hypothetical protein DEIPH_ctg045orf0001 [Deinococcus phoenicis]
MTAPTLPETLERLHELVPDRVTNVGYTTARVMVHDRLIYLDLEDPAQFGPWLEYALREECAARGLRMSYHQTPLVGGGYGWLVGLGDPLEAPHLGAADTPAEALGLALLKALTAQVDR